MINERNIRNGMLLDKHIETIRLALIIAAAASSETNEYHDQALDAARDMYQQYEPPHGKQK